MPDTLFISLRLETVWCMATEPKRTGERDLPDPRVNLPEEAGAACQKGDF